MNKQQLANKIWESANKMRSKIEANEYKDYILGFIFYKFLSDKETKYLKSLGYTAEDLDTVTEDDTEIVENVKKNIGYFISYENLFSTWLEMGSDFNAANVTDALSAFSRLINPAHSKVFKDIFKTLETGLSKLGDTSGARTKAISDLIHLIKDIPMDGKQDYDVLGFIYEYLISNFAANAGKKAGEFYTPHEVSLLMSEIIAEHLKERTEIKIYDPTSGSGSLLINIGKSVSKYMSDSNGIKYYAQELKENTYNLTRMNLVMRGINPANILAITFTNKAAKEMKERIENVEKKMNDVEKAIELVNKELPLRLKDHEEIIVMPKCNGVSALTARSVTLNVVATAKPEAHYQLTRDINANIKNYYDSLWWSLNATSIGDSNVYPITVNGRIVGVFLILIGYGLFTINVATISSVLNNFVKNTKKETMK